MKYRKKPVEIEAVLWTGKNLREIITFTDGKEPDTSSVIAMDKWQDYEWLVKNEGLKIFTLEGNMMANVGDYIIKGVQGECYPCKPDIFELTYDKV